METQELLNFVTTEGGRLAINLATALVTWFVGRWLIKLTVGLMGRLIERGHKIDTTLSNYLKAVVSALLNVVLILAILDIFGIETTSFAALLAGAGVAVGAAWSGMLGNFAAGMFLQVLRPYKVGDYISAGGIEGTVRELGILATILVTSDGVLATVGNNKIFSDTIKNYSVLPLRQVSCNVKVANSVNPLEAIERLRPIIAALPGVVADPPLFLGIKEFTAEGPRLSISPYAKSADYWSVYFAVNQAIVETFSAAGYPAPEMPVACRVAGQGTA